MPLHPMLRAPLAFLALITLLMAGLGGATPARAEPPAAAASLREAARPFFLVGVAVNPRQCADDNSTEARLIRTVVGHTLVWHAQTPGWVFAGENGAPPTRELLLARMRDHIATVVGRYKGRVQAWDVVNEALNDDGTLRDSPWRRIIGDDHV